MERRSRVLFLCAFALSVTPAAASPTEVWFCNMQNGERWDLGLSAIWGLGLVKGAKASGETYKIEKSTAPVVRATGPYGPKGELASRPDLVIFDPKSGELTVTTMGSSEKRKGKCDLQPLPEIRIKPG